MNQENAVAKVQANPLDIFKVNITTDVQASVLPLSALKPIGSAEEKAKAEELLQKAKKVRGAVETIRKNVTDPLVTAQKEYIAAEKTFAAQLDSEIARVTTDINRWNNAELKRVRDEQQKAKEDGEAAIRRKRSEQGVASVEIQVQAQVQQIAKTAPTSIKTTFVFKAVTNAELVPREFLSVDTAKVAQAIKNGVRSIPGISIEEQAVRTGR
jgi:hypothetical protein